MPRCAQYFHQRFVPQYPKAIRAITAHRRQRNDEFRDMTLVLQVLKPAD